MRFLLKDESIFWIVIQQLFQRGLIAVKFFVIAKFLGAEEVGVISILLLIIAILESVSDFGINAMYISSKKQFDDKLKSIIFTWQTTRGIIIFCMYIIVFYVLFKMNVINFSFVNNIYIYIFGSVILFKSLNNINVFEYIKARKFKKNSLFIISIAFVDFFLSMISIFYFKNVEVLIIFSIITEILKMGLSHIIFKRLNNLKLNFSFSEINNELEYGKSVWKNNLVIVFLSQIDKIIITIMYTPFFIGIYQMLFKITSLAFTDSFQVLNQYYLSIMAKESNNLNFKQSKLKNLKRLKIIFIGSIFISVILILSFEKIVNIFLNDDWKDYKLLFILLTVNSLIGALNSLLNTIFKSVGAPKFALKAVYIQLFISCFYLLTIYLMGQISLNTIAIGILLSNLIGCSVLMITYIKFDR